MTKKAIITGIRGQDGTYLKTLLLSKGYEVMGFSRELNISDQKQMDFYLEKHMPDEVYNLASQSDARVSTASPRDTIMCNCVGVSTLLESIRNVAPHCKFFQASSSQVFGDAPCPETGFTELSKATPNTVYASSKLFAQNLVKSYRENFGIHASVGILFNHESPLRKEQFVTRKITKAAARIKLGLQDKLELGNLDSSRDWGFAGDFVEAFWKMLQQDTPDDYIISTGKTCTVGDFLYNVFEHAGIEEPHKYIVQRTEYMNSKEIPFLLGNPYKAKRNLGWTPRTSLSEVAKMMYDNDYKMILENEYEMQK